MPEGDVVARAASRLNRALVGLTLTTGELRWPDLGGVSLSGEVVVTTATYGKNMLTRLESGNTLRTHFRMEGVWQIARTGQHERLAHSPEARAVLGNDSWTCVGLRLGMVDLVPTCDERALIGHLGPDILAHDFDAEAVAGRLRAQGSRVIGEALIDQKVLAGIGTIFMAEPLFRRKLSPWTPIDAIDDEELATIVTVARDLMKRSIAGTGEDPYVHSRLGQPCKRCGTTIEIGAVNEPPFERPAFFCPRCQKERPSTKTHRPYRR